MSNTALIMIDIQNDYFEDGRWPVEHMATVAQNAARVLAYARRADHTIIHIRHESLAPDAPFFRPGTHGAEIHAHVTPKDGESVIVKHRPNSFHDTPLRQILEDGAITDIVICGAMTQMCVDATARAAVDFGYALNIIEDACGAKEQNFNTLHVSAAQTHAAFMAPLAMSYARVITCEAYLLQAK